MTGLSHYFKGMATIEDVDFEEPNPASLMKAAPEFQKAKTELENSVTKAHEVLEIAKTMKGSGGFQRRIRIVSTEVMELSAAIDTLSATLARGKYPSSSLCASAASALNKVTSPFERNAQVELGAFEERKTQVAHVKSKSDKANVKKDLERLQGTWAVVSLQISGKLEPDEQIKEMQCKLIIKEGNFTWLEKGKEKSRGTFRIDATVTPKRFDLLVAGKKKELPGLYQFEGDILIYVAGVPRPTTFKSLPKTDHEVMRLKRE